MGGTAAQRRRTGGVKNVKIYKNKFTITRASSEASAQNFRKHLSAMAQGGYVVCPSMLADIRSSAAEPTVRSTATQDGARRDDEGEATRGADEDHRVIRDVLLLTLDDVTDYIAGARTYQARQAVEWIRHDDEGNHPPWSFDWCCRELGADPGAAYSAIIELSRLRAAQQRRQRR